MKNKFNPLNYIDKKKKKLNKQTKPNMLSIKDLQFSD